MTSTIKADVIEASTGTNTDLTLQGKGTGVPALASGATVGGNAIAATNNIPGANLIINGDMRIAQRGTSFTGGTGNADDTYTLDRFYNLAEGSDSVDITQAADSPNDNGYSYAMDVETTGEKFGLAQIIEADNCIGAIGNTVTLSFSAKVSDARIDTVKAAIIAWSGTADTVTSDFISTWNADGTTPTLIANATFENTPADLGVTTAWATYSVSAAVDTASANNIIVFIWSDDATNPLAGDFLYVTNVKLEVGSTATDFVPDDYATALAKCQRYYWEPGFGTNGFANGTTTVNFPTIWPVQMRSAPTISDVDTTPTINDGVGGDITSSGTTSTLVNADVNGGVIRMTGFSGLTQYRPYYINSTASHVALSAEL